MELYMPLASFVTLVICVCAMCIITVLSWRLLKHIVNVVQFFLRVLVYSVSSIALYIGAYLLDASAERVFEAPLLCAAAYATLWVYFIMLHVES